ncbi:Arf-GAP with GTPase, ANK repeat and PH domain-containing protein 1 [Vulpes lagopus]
MNYQQQLANSAAIRAEIQRFESVHPNIYSIYELLERVEEPVLQNQIREHVIAIEGEARAAAGLLESAGERARARVCARVCVLVSVCALVCTHAPGRGTRLPRGGALRVLRVLQGPATAAPRWTRSLGSIMGRAGCALRGGGWMLLRPGPPW